MGGYGAYVWSSYGIWLIVMVINYIQPKLREKKLLRELKRRQLLKQQQL